ncbi:MAG: hypothetical protein ACKVYV_07375 [Limisphaerales bacterium]
MNAVLPGPGLRRVPRWAWGAAVIFVAQVAVIWWLGGRGTPRPPPPDPWRGRFLAHDAVAVPGWLDGLSPTVFLLPGPDDFSGVAWLRPVPAPYPAEAFAAEPRPLPAAQAWAAAVPPDFPSSPAASPAVRWTPPALATPVAPPVPLAGACWRLVSAPSGVRLLAAAPPATPGTNAGPAGPVTLRVAFDAAGHVSTPPAVAASSGLPAADAAALAAARALRFAVPAAEGRPGDTAGWAEVELNWGAGGAAP